MKRVWVYMLLFYTVMCCGCVHVMTYPKFMDSPQFQAALIEGLCAAQKSFEAEGEFFDPGIEFFFKQSMGVGTHGVKSSARFMAAGGPTAPTPPAQETP